MKVPMVSPNGVLSVAHREVTYTPDDKGIFMVEAEDVETLRMHGLVLESEAPAPSPANDIAAVRAENERLRNAIDDVLSNPAARKSVLSAENAALRDKLGALGIIVTPSANA